MDDTQVDWTRRIEEPAPVPPPHDGPSSEERIERLERAARRWRVFAAVLGAVLVIAVGFGAALLARVEHVARSVTVLEEQALASGVSDEAAGDDDGASELSEGAAIDSHASSGISGEDEAGEGARELRAADLSALVNEKWSNGLRILDAYGIDSDDLVIVTDDGGMVVDPGNWTVTLVADLEDEGTVAVYLRHDIDWF